MIRRALLLTVLAIALLPTTVFAQPADTNDREDVLIRINAPVHVAAGETAGTVIVISDNATIDGVIDNLIVLDGDATIAGTVRHDVTIVSGTVTLQAGAHVEEDVLLYRADAVEEPGATVAGGIHEERAGFTIGRGFWLALWLSMTVAVVASGLLFAAVGGRQLREAATAVTTHVGGTLLSALLLWTAVPVLAVLIMVTVIGIPLGIGVLMFLLPALWFIGYLVAGAALGSVVVRTSGEGHPYLPTLVGLLIFQFIALIPFIGATVGLVAGLVGAGALAYRIWRGWRGEAAARQPGAPAAPAAPAT